MHVSTEMEPYYSEGDVRDLYVSRASQSKDERPSLFTSHCAECCCRVAVSGVGPFRFKHWIDFLYPVWSARTQMLSGVHWNSRSDNCIMRAVFGLSGVVAWRCLPHFLA